MSRCLNHGEAVGIFLAVLFSTTIVSVAWAKCGTDVWALQFISLTTAPSSDLAEGNEEALRWMNARAIWTYVDNGDELARIHFTPSTDSGVADIGTIQLQRVSN